MLKKLLQDHAMMRQKAQTLVDLLGQDSMPDRQVLANKRWQLSSFIMQHLAFEDRHLYSKLPDDERPQVVALGKRFQADLAELFTSFADHAQFWTPDRIAGDWHGFRASARNMISAMEARIDREEAELFPLFAGSGIDRANGRAPTNNWTREAFAIKDAMTIGARA